MEEKLFQDYSKKSVHFYDESFPFFLKLGFDWISTVEKPRIVDLGCGDGKLLNALYQKGLLNGFSEIIGVDISSDRIERLKKELPFVKGVISDASSVKGCVSSFFDLIICSQVIEHVRNDESLIIEIYRLLKCNGVAYISTVMKHWYGVYFYFKNGSFRLDPTHIREYLSSDEFVSLIKSKGFKIININTHQIAFPIVDLLYRLFIKFGFAQPDPSFFQKHKFLAKMRKLVMPIVGYNHIDVLVTKNE